MKESADKWHWKSAWLSRETEEKSKITDALTQAIGEQLSPEAGEDVLSPQASDNS